MCVDNVKFKALQGSVSQKCKRAEKCLCGVSVVLRGFDLSELLNMYRRLNTAGDLEAMIYNIFLFHHDVKKL